MSQENLDVIESAFWNKGVKASPAETCLTCKRYVQVTKTSGECRRYPPVAIDAKWLSKNDQASVQFPVVLGVMWCGEYLKA